MTRILLAFLLLLLPFAAWAQITILDDKAATFALTFTTTTGAKGVTPNPLTAEISGYDPAVCIPTMGPAGDTIRVTPQAMSGTCTVIYQNPDGQIPPTTLTLTIAPPPAAPPETVSFGAPKESPLP